MKEMSVSQNEKCFKSFMEHADKLNMKTKSVCKAIALSVVALALSGCSVKGSIEEYGEVVRSSIFGQQSGLVSASAQSQIVNGYNVSSSLGHMTDSVQQTANGYTVYSGIQGSTSADISIEQ
jgi:hypothetical protein